MSLRNESGGEIEKPQARAVINAGAGLSGCFVWTTNGWELTLKGLSFHELILVVESAKEVMLYPGGLNCSDCMTPKTTCG